MNSKEKRQKKNNTKKKKITSVWKLVIRVALIFVILIATYIGYFMIQKENVVEDVFEGIETKEAHLTEYIIYGTHLNIKGNLSIESSDIKDVALYFKTLDEEDSKEVKMQYKKLPDGVQFYTSDLINEGIDLETLYANTYYIFVKVENSNDTYKYYPIKNETKYEDVEYYTITKNEKNNKINIKFATHNIEEDTINYMYINVIDTKLPKDVYDIVIDPGHRRWRCGSRRLWI